MTMFSEIIKMWCNKNVFVFLWALVKCTSAWPNFRSWHPTDVTGILMDDTVFWQSHQSPVWFDEISPAPSTFPPPGLSQLLFLTPSSLPSLSFIPGDIACPGTDLTLWKPNTSTEKGDDWMSERTGECCERGPQANWQLGVKVSLSPPRSHSFTPFCPVFYCSVHPLWRESWTSVHPVVCWNEEKRSAQTSDLTENCQKSPSPVKTKQHIHSKPEHNAELFVFPHSLQMITQSQMCCWIAVLMYLYSFAHSGKTFSLPDWQQTWQTSWKWRLMVMSYAKIDEITRSPQIWNENSQNWRSRNSPASSYEDFCVF